MMVYDDYCCIKMIPQQLSTVDKGIHIACVKMKALNYSKLTFIHVGLAFMSLARTKLSRKFIVKKFLLKLSLFIPNIHL